MSSQRRELLDVEDDDARQQRIQSLLESTDAATVKRRQRPELPILPRSNPYPIPTSDLIARVQAFLPRLAASNNELVRQAALDPNSVDIEHLGENPGPLIEMNLGLGVFEQRTRLDQEATSSDSSSDGSDNGDGNNSEDGNSSEDENFPSPKKVLIEVLASKDEPTSEQARVEQSPHTPVDQSPR